MPSILRADGVKLSYEFLPGSGPIAVFLPGFASDMNGTKALKLQEVCAARGQAMLRLDYSGHGSSAGDFQDGCIGIWTDDADAIIQAAASDRPLILVGSSMGGWIALLLALRLSARIKAMLLVAPAPDFTRQIEAFMTASQRVELSAKGCFYPPSEYGPPAPITAKLLADGTQHLLLGKPINLICPVRILHGMVDEAVPWQNSLKLIEAVQSQDVNVNFIKDGDHRLSRPQDLALLAETLVRLFGQNCP